MEDKLTILQSKRNLIVRWLRIFLIITVVSIIVVLVFTTGKDTLQAFRNFSPLYFLLALLVTATFYYFELLRVQVLGRAMGKPISLRTASEFYFGGCFLTIVPTGVVGVPFQLYVLHRDGLNLGEAGNVIIMRAILNVLILPLFIPIILLEKELLRGRFVVRAGSYVGIIVLLLVILFIVFLFMPKRWSKGKFSRVYNELQKLRVAIKQTFTHGKLFFLLSFGTTLIARCAFFTIPYVLFKGLGVDPPFLTTFVIQIILSYLLLFIPTPGSTGVAEAGGFGFWRLICPTHLLGLYVIIWRFYTGLLAMIIGGILILRLLYQPKSDSTRS